MTFGDLPTEVDDDDAPSGSGGGAATGSAWGGGGGSARPGGVETIGREERFWDGEKGYGFTTNRLCSEPGKYFGIKELIGDVSFSSLPLSFSIRRVVLGLTLHLRFETDFDSQAGVSIFPHSLSLHRTSLKLSRFHLQHHLNLLLRTRNGRSTLPHLRPNHPHLATS